MNIQTYNWKYLNTPFKEGCQLFEVPELNVDDIHVWSVHLNLPDNLVTGFRDLISREERKKADSFRFPHLKRQYIVFHAILRKVLAYYLRIDENYISYTQGSYGKPALVEDINPLKIQFSMSKSDETGIYAFMRGNEIGIDIEKIKPLSDMRSIVKRHFSEEEKKIYKELHECKKVDWFFTVWTRKEALLKAIGCGLYLPLEQVDVSSMSNIKINSDVTGLEKASSNYILDDLKIAPEFKSAICMARN